jgi:hypothetical protein
MGLVASLCGMVRVHVRPDCHQNSHHASSTKARDYSPEAGYYTFFEGEQRNIYVRIDVNLVRIAVMLVVLVDPPLAAHTEQQVAKSGVTSQILTRTHYTLRHIFGPRRPWGLSKTTTLSL